MVVRGDDEPRVIADDAFVRAQVLDGVEKLRLALRRGGGGVGVDKRAEVDDVLLGIIPGRILRHVVTAIAETSDIRLRATIGEQQIEEEIIAELILLCDLRDALLNFPDAKRSPLGLSFRRKHSA